MMPLMPVLHGAPDSPFAIVETMVGILGVFFLFVLVFLDRTRQANDPPNQPDPDEDSYLPPARS